VQEVLRPKEEALTAERDKVEDLRGAPLQVGTLEEMIDDNHAIGEADAASLTRLRLPPFRCPVRCSLFRGRPGAVRVYPVLRGRRPAGAWRYGAAA
jgi:hypothetical protein